MSQTPDQFLNRARQAVETLRREGTRLDLAVGLRNLGEVERALDAGAARQHYQEAVALLRTLDQPLRLAHTIRHLGDIYHDGGEAALAEPCYDEALALYRRHGGPEPLDLANAIRSMAVLQEEKGEVESARRLWDEARDLYTVARIPEAVVETSARLTRLAGGQGDVQE